MNVYLLEVFVTVDVLLVVGVLQLVGLDVLPQRLDDAGPGLGVDPQQPGQAGVQLELGWLRTDRRTDGQASGQVTLPTTSMTS